MTTEYGALGGDGHEHGRVTGDEAGVHWSFVRFHWAFSPRRVTR